ncbi:MAG: cyclase family protein [Dehalococcoidia bacterium]
MVDLNALPTYRDLPLFEGQDERHAWGVFGADDDLGTVNLLTDERVLEASRLMKRGRAFSLDLTLDLPLRKPLEEGERGRGPYEHHVVTHRGGGDDKLDNFYLQGSSQWDGLRHIRYREFGYYNGVQDDDLASDRIGIEKWAEHGIAGRAVLLDLPRFMGDRFSVHERIAVDGPLIEEIARHQGVEVRPADILLLRTGWMANYLALDDEAKADPAAMDTTVPTPGLDGTQETAAWLWDHRIVSVAADNIAVEALPVLDSSFQHRRLIAMFGMPLGELWTLEALAEDCAEDGVYECFLVAKPLALPRGVGSPPNALAFK